MKKILLILTFSIVSVFAYDVEKEGDFYLVYDGNDIVGSYYKSVMGEYSVGCDSPKLMQHQKRYRETDSYPMNKTYSTKREAESTITKYCKKR